MRRICTSFILLFILAAAHFSFAQVEIIDKGNVFRSLNFWGQGLPFEQAFTCGQSESYSATVASCKYKCNNSYCVSTCSGFSDGKPAKYKFQVEDCTKDSVHIYGENGFEAKITKSDYELAGNNWLIGLLKAHALFITPEGRVELNFSSARKLDVISGGEKRQVNANIVFGTIFSSTATQGFAFELILLPGVTGLKQLAYFRADREDIFLKQRGVSDAQP